MDTRVDPWMTRDPYDDIPSDVEPGNEIRWIDEKGEVQITKIVKDQPFRGGDAANPEHYSRWAIEPIVFIKANNLPFDVGNVIKYVMRYDAKDGLRDLKKARQYINFMIDHEENK